MPIRFDSGGGGNNNRGNSGGRNNNDGRAGLAVLLIFLAALWKYPRFTLTVVAAVVIYFVFFDDGQLLNQLAENNDQKELFSLGCNIDEEKYDKTEVFEPLAASSSKNKIPSSASLLEYAPRRLSQGQQGSCVGWASAYAARTILEAKATGRRPNDVTFSPSFLYNQIALDGCNGTYTSEALKKMYNDGLLFFSKFKYDPSSCSRQPTRAELAEAENYRIRGYNRLTKSGRNYDVDMNSVRQNIAQGAPVIIAMKVPPSFHYAGKVWEPSRGEANKVRNYGGHAMCLIGYDDNYKGGAFQIMNSWGNDWGDNGISWVRYDDFYTFCREAYGLYPHRKAKTVNSEKFAVNFGLVNSSTDKNIPLKKVSGNLFTTSTPIKKETLFKVEVTNSVDCYTYVFGQETDGSSYRLFPYFPGHSAYCGIVGTRYFPKGDENLRADGIGERDYMAVVVTKKPIDFDDLNDRISNARGRTYEEKVLNALGNEHIKNVRFSNKSDGTVGFEGSANGRNAVAMIFEIDKR